MPMLNKAYSKKLLLNHPGCSRRIGARVDHHKRAKRGTFCERSERQRLRKLNLGAHEIVGFDISGWAAVNARNRVSPLPVFEIEPR